VQTTSQAIGPIAGGLAYDASGSYVPAFSAFAIAGFAASVFVFLARPPARG